MNRLARRKGHHEEGRDMMKIDWRSRKVHLPFLLWSLLFLLLGLGLSLLLKSSYREYYDKNILNGLEVRKKPFLAAELFLKQYNKTLITHNNYQLFDDHIDTSSAILISKSHNFMSQRRLNQLRRFVTQGGHLILTPEQHYNDEKQSNSEPILDELGIRVYHDDDISSNTTSRFTFSDKQSNTWVSSPATLFEKQGQEQEKNYVEVHFSLPHYLIDNHGRANDIGGSLHENQLLSYVYGKGRITVMVDDSIFKNNVINQYDHALFLWQLIESQSQLHIIYNSTVESLWVLLWQYAYPLVISGFALLLIIIAFHQIKTGPVFPQFSVKRRQLTQHLLASAEFKVHHQQHQSLLDVVRQDVFTLLSRKSKLFKTGSQEEQIHWITAHTSLSPELIQSALFDSAIEPHLLTHHIQTLQKIRTQL